MLLPDHIKPEDTVYYNGSIVLAVLLRNGNKDLLSLYTLVCNERGMSFPLFILCIDWLFLLGTIKMDHQTVKLCSSKNLK